MENRKCGSENKMKLYVVMIYEYEPDCDRATVACVCKTYEDAEKYILSLGDIWDSDIAEVEAVGFDTEAKTE